MNLKDLLSSEEFAELHKKNMDRFKFKLYYSVVLYKKNSSLLTKNFLNKKRSVWMSHEDAVVKLPKKFKLVASTKESKFTIIENFKNKIYGVQFHPEVTHTDNGKQIFKNFIFSICKIKKNGIFFLKRRH